LLSCVHYYKLKEKKKKKRKTIFKTKKKKKEKEILNNDLAILPSHDRHDAVMTVVDSVVKQAHFIPTHMTMTAEGAARLFLHQVWKLHGLPKCVILDCGPQFVARFTKKLYRLLGIKLASSTAWHPQTDRQMEHVNQELDQYLWLFVNKRQDN